MKSALVTVVLFLTFPLVWSQVKIGDNPQDINSASILELESNSRALVITRVGDTEMQGMFPLRGALVYNTDQECVFYYNGASWENLCSDNNTTNLSLELLDSELILTDSQGNTVSVELGSSIGQTFSTNPIVNFRETIIITQDNENYNFEVGLITGDNIVDTSILGADLADNSITVDKLAPDSVGQEELRDNAVTDASIDYTQVTLTDFDNDAGYITSAQIISPNPNNAITDDNGAFYDDSVIVNDIATNTTNITNHIALDTDLDDNNERLSNAVLDGTELVLTEGLTEARVDLGPILGDTNTDNQDADEVSIDAITGIVGANVQLALEELQTDIDGLIAGGGADGVVSNITTTGNNLVITGTGGGFNGNVNLEPLVDNAVSDNGFLTMEADGSINNELTDIDFDATTNILTLTNPATIGGASVDLSPLVGGAADGNNFVTGGTLNVESLELTGNGGGAGATVDLSDFALDTDIFTLPDDSAASNGDVLITDGAGVYSWATVAGGGTDTNNFINGGTLNVESLELTGNGGGAGAIVDLSAFALDSDLTGFLTTEIDGVIGNEVTQTADGTLVITGSGTDIDPLTIDVSPLGITNAELNNNAVTTDKISDGQVQTDDIADANVTGAKIAPGGDGEVLTTNGTDVVWAAPTTGAATLTDGNIFVGGAGDVPTDVAMSGDATITNAGVIDLTDDAVELAEIAQNGATDGQVLKWDNTAGEWITADDEDSGTPTLTDGNIFVGGTGDVPTDVAMSGDATITNTGVIDLSDDAVELSEIAQNGATAGQILKWDGTNWALGTDEGASVTGTPNSVFVAAADGSPTDYGNEFYLDPLGRVAGGGNFEAVYIGVNTALGQTNNAKVQIADNADGVAYALQLSNLRADEGNEWSTGILFSPVDFGPIGKGGLVYQRKDLTGLADFGRGDFHFLQNANQNEDLPTLADYVMTIKNNGNVGLRETDPTQQLHITDNMRLEGDFYDSTNDQGAVGEVLTINTGGLPEWLPAGSGTNTNFADNNLTLAADRTHNLNGNNLQLSGIGNVRIGSSVTVNSNKLHVEGTIRAEGIRNTPGTLPNSVAYSFNGDSDTGIYRAGPNTLGLVTTGSEAIRINAGGDVGIGLDFLGGATIDAKLHVLGDAIIDGTIFTDNTILPIPDYVFQNYFDGYSDLKEDYQFKSLKDIEAFVKKNKHLPGVTSAAQAKKEGHWNLSQSNLQNLEKIEELFLHTIEQEKKIQSLKEENQSLVNELESLKKDMEAIKTVLLKKEVDEHE